MYKSEKNYRKQLNKARDSKDPIDNLALSLVDNIFRVHSVEENLTTSQNNRLFLSFNFKIKTFHDGMMKEFRAGNEITKIQLLDCYLFATSFQTKL